ncbi:DUF6879 family protein [Embleya sp. NPDC005575]|uniref:DUF6879 family protein n=1 Tax=Embleya sp. NPDC005575 TaxID=3156892 RepID=UPI0033B70217
MLLTGDDFNDLFRSFEASAFKMETRDFYDVEGERTEFRLFLDGGRMPEEWHDNPWVREIVGAGKTMSRVHVLRSPLTDYLRFELGWGYPGNIAAGENIQIVDLTEKAVDGLPDHDFWLFDDSRIYRMHYTDGGEFIGAAPLADESLETYRSYRDTALFHGEPYLSYWARAQA